METHSFSTALPPLGQDVEYQLVARLLQATPAVASQIAPIDLVNLYVALKTKPLALLVGPAQSGKIAALRGLAQVLTDGDPFRCQILIGHPWWAKQSGNIALCTEAQTRLNTHKLIALLEETWQPENAHRLCLAGLTRISPAEVSGYFSEIAAQIQTGAITCLPSVHLDKPIPYPSNLLLVGTMDTADFAWMDEHLLAQATVIRWPTRRGAIMPAPRGPEVSHVSQEASFEALIRNARAARRKLRWILKTPLLALRPLAQMKTLWKNHVDSPASVMLEDVLTYLANAWTAGGRGLFDPAPAINLGIALDLSIAQYCLPRARLALQQSLRFRHKLAALLNNQFPHSMALLTGWGGV